MINSFKSNWLVQDSIYFSDLTTIHNNFFIHANFLYLAGEKKHPSPIHVIQQLRDSGSSGVAMGSEIPKSALFLLLLFGC